VTLIETQANGPLRHSLTAMASPVLGWCNAGFDDNRVGRLVGNNAFGLHSPLNKQSAAQGE
jgi:hypothetical protein